MFILALGGRTHSPREARALHRVRTALDGNMNALTRRPIPRRSSVRWFSRRKLKPGTLRPSDTADLDHLKAFASSRQGVEAFLEPRTAVTEATIVLVARDGEWTRRRIGGPEAAQTFTKKLALPLYEAGRVGYPQRMRDWTAQRKAEGQS